MGYSRIQEKEFRVDPVLGQLEHAASGGVAFYIGRVRGSDGRRTVETLEYQAYGPMAQSELEKVRAQAVERFGLLDAIFIHRVGRFGPGEPVLLVALSAKHRQEAFEALPHVLDRLKADVPIWKKEEGSEGEAWLLGKENRRVSP